MPIRATPLVLGVCLAVVVGCGPAKLNKNEVYSLEPGASQVLDLPAISKPQRITVDFSSSASDVNVYLIKDFKERDGLDAPPIKAQILAHQQGKTGNLVVDVSADTATRVVIRGGNDKTDVTIKVTNSK